MEKPDLPSPRAENTSVLLGTCFLPVGSGEEGRAVVLGSMGGFGFILPVEQHPQKNGVPGPCLLPRQGKTDEKQ